MNDHLMAQLADIRDEILAMQRRLLDLHQHLEQIQREFSVEQIDQRKALIQDLIKDERGSIMDIYPLDLLERFIFDRSELPHLRCLAIQEYLRAGSYTSEFLDQLSHDPFSEVRVCLSKAIAEYNLSLPESTWMQLMSEPTHDIMLNATRSASKQVALGNLHPRVFTAVRQQEYFLIKDLAVRTTIDAAVPDEEKLALLTQFTTATYFKTRRSILDYFERLGASSLVPESRI